MTLATAMFRHIWEARRDQAKEMGASGKREILRLEKEIEGVLDRIMTASNDTIIRRYEDKVEVLERQKALMVENTAKQAEPKGAFEEKLGLACQFLASPWKIWGNGTPAARRLVLKLAFTTPIEYCRKEGARTPDLSLPFKALKDVPAEQFCCGAQGETRTLTPVKAGDFESPASTIPPLGHVAFSTRGNAAGQAASLRYERQKRSVPNRLVQGKSIC